MTKAGSAAFQGQGNGNMDIQARIEAALAERARIQQEDQEQARILSQALRPAVQRFQEAMGALNAAPGFTRVFGSGMSVGSPRLDGPSMDYDVREALKAIDPGGRTSVTRSYVSSYGLDDPGYVYALVFSQDAGYTSAEHPVSCSVHVLAFDRKPALRGTPEEGDERRDVRLVGGIVLSEDVMEDGLAVEAAAEAFTEFMVQAAADPEHAVGDHRPPSPR